jgi:diacylglycerol kinase family enzyme
VDGKRREAYQVFIFNGKYYGGFLKGAPNASMEAKTLALST